MIKCVHIDSSIWHHLIILISFLLDCVILIFFFLASLLLKDKQEVKFGGVMSVQNTHYIPIF